MAKSADIIYIPDGSFSWAGGVDSSLVTTVQSALNPQGLPRNALAWLNNATVRGGGITQRTGFQPLLRLIASGKWQMGMIYEPDGANPYLLCQVSGVLYSALLEPPYTITDLTKGNPLLLNPVAAEMAFFVQGEDFAVIQAGDYYFYANDADRTLPLIWNGFFLRRSIGITTPAAPAMAPGINEIPAATSMWYHGSRIWYALGRGVAAGDIAGGPSGTKFYHFRDSILSVTENPLCFGGDGFTLPTTAGNIRALREEVNLNESVGQSRLLIWTRKSVFALSVPPTRTDWINADINNGPSIVPVQRESGSVGDRCVVASNGDWFYQSFEPAIRSLITAVRQYNQWGNTPISQNELRALAQNNRALMRFSSGIVFDNRLLMAVLPQVAVDGINVIHRAILPLDFDVVSNLATQTDTSVLTAPVWEGALDGLNILQLFEGDFGGLPRAFTVVISDVDGSINVWEITNSNRFENGDNRVLWSPEFPAYTWDTAGLEFKLKQLKGGELWVDKVAGRVDIEVYYRTDADPCWRRWFITDLCSARCEDYDSPLSVYPCEPFREGYKFPIVFPEPPPRSCDSMGVRPTTIGYQFQTKIMVRGWCRIRSLILYAIPHTDPQYHGIACPSSIQNCIDPMQWGLGGGGILPTPPVPIPPPTPPTPPAPPEPPTPPTPPVYVPFYYSLPVITGTVQVGDTLSGSNGTWANSPTGYSYRWLANGVAIGGATTNTFLLTSAQIGAVITFEVTASNAGGSGAAATSTATSAVLPAVPVNSVLPVITGTAQDGQTLSGSDGTWSNSPTGYAYRWLANGVAIGGATSNTFLLTSAQIGDTITFEVTASNAGGNGAPTTSTATSAVLPAVPVNTVVPAITGTARVGDTLSGSNGTWTNTPTGYAYEWLANGTPIGGATANTFLLTGAQVGDVITFQVTASNAGGSGSPATSSATSTVTGAPNALATAWASQVVTNGGAAPSGATVTALSTFCDALDAASLTAKMIAVNCIVPDSLIAAQTPIIHNFGLAKWDSYYFSAGDLTVDGLTGNGTTKFLDTGVIPDTCVTDSSVSVVNYCTLAGSAITSRMGAADGGSALRFAWYNAASLGDYFCCLDTAAQFGTGNTAAYFLGYICGSKSSASIRDIYKANSTTTHYSAGSNNVADGGGSNTPPSNRIYCFASHEFSGAAGFYPGTMSFIAIGTALSAADSLALYNAVQALRTALGGGWV